MLTIYKASAGSGKTYTLAYEYIRMLLGVKRPKSSHNDADSYRLNLAKYDPNKRQYANKHRAILAITFTNKATDEMKQRIISNLNDLSKIPANGQPDADYAPKLMLEYGCSRQELADAAHIALQQILFDYHFFHVSTIDSFFQRVLRTFARELDRQGDFNIELDDQSAIQAAVGAMLDDFNTGENQDKGLDSWILDYVSDKIANGTKTNFFNRSSRLFGQMIKSVSRICNEGYKPYADQMERYLSARDDQGKGNLEKLRKHIKERSNYLKECLKQKANALFGPDAELDLKWFYAEPARAIQAMIDGSDKVFKEFSKLKDRKFFSPPGVDLELKNKKVQLSPELTQQIKDLFSEAFFIHRSLPAVLKSLDTLSLLSFASTYLHKISAEENILLLSSTNDMLQRIIGNDETPFVYERMGIELHNFLIDEFQDTSRMQWQNLRPLVSNALAEQNDSLIIGDVKQSIYRFRNSDSSLLHTEVADFYGRGTNCQIKGDSPGDNTNYRSSQPVVAFNNTLFSIIAAESIGDSPVIPGYQGLVQIIKNTDKKGYVKFVAYDGLTPSKEDNRLKMMQDMCANILRQHYQGNCPWRKIAILVNRKDEGTEAIEYIMANHPDMPVMSGESLLVNKSSAVQLILSFLKIIDRIQSASEPTTSEQKPFPSFSEVSMMLSRYEYFASKGIDMSQALECAINPQMACSIVGSETPTSLMGGIDQINQRNPSSLQSLIDTIINLQISPEQRHSQLAYILAFQDIVTEYCEHNVPSVHSFLKWWAVNGDSKAIQGSDDIDAIRVMTIHKSKGLEFECVHIPFGSWDMGDKHANSLWIETPKFDGFPPDLLPPVLLMSPTELLYDPYFQSVAKQEILLSTTDVMNKTYVAYTRAITELIVYYSPNDGIGKLLCMAFGQGLPKMPADSARPWITDLRPYYDPSSGNFEMGTPIEMITAEVNSQEQKKSKRNSIVNRKETLLIDYDVIFRQDADVLTTIDNQLELDSDIDDVHHTDQTVDTSEQEYENDEARLRGIQLHDILSQIKTKDDIDKAVAQVADFHRLDNDKRKHLSQCIHSFLNQEDDRISKWFGGKGRIIVEQPIYIPSKDIIKRPDRIVVYPDATVDVIDYKFTSSATKQHLEQIRLYANLLRDMGYRQVRGFLWYPLKNLIKCS